MSSRHRPAFDPSIAPEQGVTRDGQPLSYNRAPAPDLAPWIARFYVTKVQAPADYTLACSLFNDVACVRIQLAGQWTAETADGPMEYERAALFFGPQSRRMPLTVTGSFISVGYAVRPGACTALGGTKLSDLVDRLVPIDTHSSPWAIDLDLLRPDATPEEWLQMIETQARESISRAGAALPDPIALRFEALCFDDPSVSVSEAARCCGVERRKLERVVHRDFGMSPKQVLRRARALDMASHLRGVADSDEGEEMALRYYDESHLIHEFTDLFGMSPRQFAARPQPILTIALESRQARRLEALHRIEPGQARPWE